MFINALSTFRMHTKPSVQSPEKSVRASVVVGTRRQKGVMSLVATRETSRSRRRSSKRRVVWRRRRRSCSWVWKECSGTNPPPLQYVWQIYLLICVHYSTMSIISTQIYDSLVTITVLFIKLLTNGCLHCGTFTNKCAVSPLFLECLIKCYWVQFPQFLCCYCCRECWTYWRTWNLRPRFTLWWGTLARVKYLMISASFCWWGTYSTVSCWA